MELPAHIAEQVRQTIAVPGLGKHHRHIDCEAARHGAIALMGTLGAVWMLRPDGSLWDADEETNKALTPLPEQDHTKAIVYGVERYPWLAELLPRRPATATDCLTCGGRGRFRFEGAIPPGATVLCRECDGLGWLSAR